MTSEQAQIVLEASHIRKSFGAVRALRGVDIRFRNGEIHALLGQNGAGKSTLVKILNGVHPAGSYSGSILLDGRTVEFASPAEARAGGVGYVPQELEVLPDLSVAENVFAGMTGLGNGLFARRRLMRQRARALFEELNLEIDPTAPVGGLSAAERHLVMIARALAAAPRVLMLDEPTASLSSTEVEGLFRVLRRLRARGVTVIYITHRLPEVLSVCDRVTVLRDGSVAAEIARDHFDADQFIFAMSGQRLQGMYPSRQATPRGSAMLEVRDLVVATQAGARRSHGPVSFAVRAGEIVGLAGLLGSGRTEILHGIYGRLPANGQIRVAGQSVSIRSPRDARRQGIALLTEDRKREGLLFNLPAGANISIGNLDPLSRYGVVRRDRERSAILATMRALDVKASSPQSSVAHLSGGNQQKLLFGRVLMRGPRILLLDEPTKGVDAATRHEIYRLIVDLAGRGVTMLVVASELEELIGLADRCLVIADGRIVDEFERGAGGEERVLRAVSAAQARPRPISQENDE
jgi:ribose transport system ATP-binding protein/D-xylose transport system ATP-binding protein